MEPYLIVKSVIKVKKPVVIATLCMWVLLFPLKGNNIETSGDDTPPLRERVFFAGNFSLQFGTFTSIEISPAIGVWLLPRFSVALGPTYQFYKDPIDKTNLYGGRAFFQFFVIEDFNNFIPIGMNAGLYLHAEYETLSLQKQFWQTSPETGRVQVHSLLGGFGFSQPIGPRSAMTMSILWLMNDHGYQIYGNPEVRVGFTF